MEQLEQQVRDLRVALDTLGAEIRQRASFEGINEATKTLASKSIKGNHNYNYLGRRFSDYELALLNIKQMGYYIGRAEASRSGSFEAMNRVLRASEEELPSKLCTQGDCETDWYYFWLQEMQCGFTYHRKLWEFCYIAQALYAHGVLSDGKRGIGFGCGEEPLASLFAKYGCSVVATDLNPDLSEEQGQGWIEAGQHGGSLDQVRNDAVCPDPAKLARISHAFVDMNRVPDHYTEQFDFCWSACALEHIGSIELGLTFIVDAMKVLRPGGVAVHTTEYNLDEGETIDNALTVLFQQHHMEDLQRRLEARGFIVSPFDFDGGSGVLDGLFDIPPWPWDAAKLTWRMQDVFTHLKRSIGGFACTSVGITIRRPA